MGQYRKPAAVWPERRRRCFRQAFLWMIYADGCSVKRTCLFEYLRMLAGSGLTREVRRCSMGFVVEDFSASLFTINRY